MKNKFIYVKLNIEDVKAIIQTFEYIKWQNGKKHEHNKTCKRIIKACEKNIKNET